jgi:taurine dioxygenase
MSVTVNPVSPALGAEIVGADLAQPVADADFVALHQALLDHLMVVVRDQFLAPEDQVALCARFGDLESHDNAQYLKDGHPEILVLSNKRVNGKLIGVPDAGDAWHSDLSFKRETAMYTVLQSVELPKTGGDTEFCNLYAAYDALPEAMRRRIADFRGIHSINKLRNPRVVISDKREDAEEFYARQDAEFPPTRHPLVRTHPETGRKLLYLSPRFTIGIGGIDEAAGQALLDELIAHTLRPEFRYRHRWRPGDLVMWDNRAVNHRACGGYDDGDIRLMHRITVLGDAPY